MANHHRRILNDALKLVRPGAGNWAIETLVAGSGTGEVEVINLPPYYALAYIMYVGD